ncbi:OmpP1/FadL family transporter [Ferrimonas lipolytica]|uniref:Aromatic hydrocarbon degradation protein n=1 Tax=Ferrimonas lipolytica TaxID=2724191 RepID=A0A6H1UAW4_9GAMM|nr:outer membrane protein transport protein [Ferrimonas lipolytica]QIZ76184.1 aromatic hydrocarbon degradation protein [Ferrimonas lipolytica]
MKVRVIAALVMGALGAQAHAAGFQLAESSATGLGRAFAGEAAIADNASSQARNSALLMELEGQQISFGFIYVDPNLDMEGTTGLTMGDARIPTADADADDFAPSALIPNFYYSNRLNDKWAVGISLNSAHGMATELPADHAAAIFGSDTSITTVELAPAVAYQLTDTVAIGAALRVVYGEGEVSATVPGWAAQTLGLEAGQKIKSVEGDGVDYGYQLGATWAPTANNRIGLSFRSEVELTLEGEAEGAGFGLAPGQKKDGELVLPLPATAELAGLHQLTDKFAMHASINWTDWSAFESLEVDFDDYSDHLKDENFKDNWRYAVGATYQVDDKMILRAGVALDKGAVSDGNRTLSIPDSDRLWFSFGSGYVLSESLTLDLAFTYIKADDASIDETVALTENVGVNYQGELGGDVWLAGAQLSYRF